MKAYISQWVSGPVCCLGFIGVLWLVSLGSYATGPLIQAESQEFARYLHLRSQFFESMQKNSNLKEQLHFLHELRFRFRSISNMDKLFLRKIKKIPFFSDELLLQTARNILKDADAQENLYKKNAAKFTACEAFAEDKITECQAAYEFKQLYEKNLSYVSECNNYIDNLEFHGWCRVGGCPQIDLLNDSDIEMRQKVIMKLGGINSDENIDIENVSANPEAHQKIAVALICDPNKQIQRRASYALLAFARYQNLSHRVIPQLEKALQSADPYIQALVKETLKLIRFPAADKESKETED